MGTRATTISWLTVGLLTAGAACGSERAAESDATEPDADGATAPAPTLGSLTAAVAASCRESFARCGCAASFDTEEDVDCIAVEPYTFGVELARATELVARGAMTFDGHVAADCLDALAAAPCDATELPCGGLSSVLWEAMRPAVPLGGACAGTLECAEGACARPDGTAPMGTCVAAGEGDPCVVWCGDAVSVSTDGAVPAGCTQSCYDSLTPTGPWDACTCERRPPFGVPLDEPCADAPLPCVDGAWCDRDADACVPLLARGEPCVDPLTRARETGGLPAWTCAPGLYCDRETSVCADRLPYAASCSGDDPPDRCSGSCGHDGRCTSLLCH